METAVDEWLTRVQEAAARLNGVANVTPVMTSRSLNERLGAEVFLKCENFQRIGAFKFRGAYNAMSRLTATERARGVLTFSSGNHAQAVALTGRLLGIATTVVMPQDAPAIKRAATMAYGARVILYDPQQRSREEIARDLQKRQGFTLIPPYDHIDVVAGQGTAALELCRQAGGIDQLLVPCGGGGLLSGCAVAARGMNPNCAVVGVEPEVADDATRSFYSGTLQTVANPPTIADGTRTPCLGRITFPLVLSHVTQMQTVSEEAIREAVRELFYRQKLVVEPSGALGLAALLSGKVKAQGRVGVILSGGNIDGPTMGQILAETAEAKG
ncbi:MAG: threo-3-hydroxy-L-aspartate ammonia-lyase [Desulfobacterales bacterium]|jgi:threonine dehydratase|nr:threo-3-hydroxy-L-aspartate ammonia-lyase [Desulfobacterales bacterium]